MSPVYDQLSGLSLDCQSLSIGYGRELVIDRLDFFLPDNASLAIVGESGCGKSTLLSALAGVGVIRDGRILWKKNKESIAFNQLRTSFVWQNLGLFPWMTVEQNLAMPFKLNAQLCSNHQEQKELIRTLLAELKLHGLQKRYPSELSGGQRQRLAIGRALIARPELLFLDEPFSALDALLRERLQDFLIEVRRTHPCQIIMVTHDIAEAVCLASHILVLAAKPFRKVAFVENRTFNFEKGCADRESDGFYETVRIIHSHLKQADRRMD